MIILGIETSCDETGAALVEAEKAKPRITLLSNIFPSSMQMHAVTGGIIPEAAAREQIKLIIPVIRQALRAAKITDPHKQLDEIAVTIGPGLVGSLLVGVETAKALAVAWNKPLIPVNHLFGHIYANWLITNNKIDTRQYPEIRFPAIALVVSGGHTDLVFIKQHGQTKWLGGTRDDAAGEALDKIGRLLNLPYPGGIAIEQNALSGNPGVYHFPRPLQHDGSFDFSFSGLKTAVLREVQKNKKLTSENIADISRATQDAIIDVLVTKTIEAVEQYQVNSLLISGGVSANKALREGLKRILEEKKLPVTFFAPDISLCTDNAAMIATAAFFNHIQVPPNAITANPELYFD